MSIQQMLLGGTLAVAYLEDTVFEYTQAGGTPTVGAQLNTNGMVREQNEGSYSDRFQWYVSDPDDTLYCRAEVVAGATPGGDSVGAALLFNVNREWTVSRALTAGSNSSTLDVIIYGDMHGSANPYARATFYLNVTRT